MPSIQPFHDVPAIEFGESSLTSDSFGFQIQPEHASQYWQSLDSSFIPGLPPICLEDPASGAHWVNMGRHVHNLENSVNGYSPLSPLKIPDAELSRLGIYSPPTASVANFRSVRYTSPSGPWGGDYSSTESANSDGAFSPDLSRHEPQLSRGSFVGSGPRSPLTYDDAYGSGYGNWSIRPTYNHSQTSCSGLSALTYNMKDLQYAPDPDLEEIPSPDVERARLEMLHPAEIALFPRSNIFRDEGLGKSIRDDESSLEGDEDDKAPTSESDTEYTPQKRTQRRMSSTTKHPAARPQRPTRVAKQSTVGSDNRISKALSNRRSSTSTKSRPTNLSTPSNGKLRKHFFTCSFSHYGCRSTFGSKNEWKRHISSQHLQLGFYRCDASPCNSDPTHHNDFNRKDLFTQHHRRMHTPWPANLTDQQPLNVRRAFEVSLEAVRNRCWRERRKAPGRSKCGFCGKTFQDGLGDGNKGREQGGSWDERMEHVGRHFEGKLLDSDHGDEQLVEGEDMDLRAWSLKAGILKDWGKKGCWLTNLNPPHLAGAAGSSGRRRRSRREVTNEGAGEVDVDADPDPDADADADADYE